MRSDVAMSLKKADKSVYCIMPVSATATCSEKEWLDIFQEVFTPAFRDCGYACKRAFPVTGNLIKSIISDLRQSWLVLADLTDRNANVFYELGVRHSLSKRTILVAQKPEDIPSDLLGYWWRVYGTKPGEVAAFRRDIAKIVSQIEAEPDKSDSPVSDFLESEQFGVSSFVARENLKKLSAMITELSGVINTLRMVESDVRYAGFINTNCLDLLLSTLYVDIGPALLQQSYELRHSLNVVKIATPRNPALIEQTRSLALDVLRQVYDLRDQMKRGEFTEPPELSVGIWAPTPVASATMYPDIDGRYSKAEDLSKVNLDDLKEHFDGPK
jgi:hypothetical protein